MYYRFWLLVFLFFFTISCNDKVCMVNNPVIPGFNPDPSVCRVGDDFYLVTSTFEYFPGVPVYHSKDLVNWKMIGHVIHRPEQMDYSNVSSTAGIYAPTIRYHNGTFYLITTMVGGIKSDEVAKTGNFIMTAKDPAGPWSEPHWIENAPGIDPSLFFDDDDKVYYCGNRHAEVEEYRAQRDIWIQEIDLETFELKGEIGLLKSKPFFESNIIGGAVAFEAPHLYKKDGTYYLLIAHGGTGMGHAVSIWKSKKPTGPWEMNPDNPILTHRGYSQSGINATGHADIFQTKDGQWYTVFLAVRSNDQKNNVMGRETFLAKVDWSGVWPVINPGRDTARTEFTFPAPELFKGEQKSPNFYDDFNCDELNLNWTFIRNPKHQWWHLDTNLGFIEMELQPEVIENYAHPAFLGIRIVDMKVSCETSLNFSPNEENECAGMAILRGHKPSWSLVKEKVGDELKASVYYTDSLLGQVNLKTNSKLDMKIELDHFQLKFLIKEPQDKWITICRADGSEMGFPPAGRFTGGFAGLYVTSNGRKVHNSAFFDHYRMNKVE